MEKIKFTCTLLSDIILSGSSATEGRHRTLDFIPGNNLLGVVARELYRSEDERTWLLFHSGKVRFGDAHPALNGVRGLHVPAAFYYPKLEKEEGGIYVHHRIENADALRPLQLKQCRSGYFAFEDHVVTAIHTVKDFVLKTAYDASRRGARGVKDRDAKASALFGYECMGKGSTYCFEVELDDEASAFRQEIIGALCGDRHIGRSRSAQFGWVRIAQEDYVDYGETNPGTADEGFVTVYAEGRLLFMDANGLPTFQPTPHDLGIDDPEAVVEWDKCQVRTFQYAPWNFCRQAYDSDRCGIEKGSVFVVRTAKAFSGRTAYVGVCQHEGFGKVIYNPGFLQTSAGGNGKALVAFREPAAVAKAEMPEVALSADDAVVFEVLSECHGRNSQERMVYDRVDRFVKEHVHRFRGDSFASQWGCIRGIAMSSKPENLVENINTYLSHGVAEEKWTKRQRRRCLDKFMMCPELQPVLQDAVINLASQMGKESNKNKQ